VHSIKFSFLLFLLFFTWVLIASFVHQIIQLHHSAYLSVLYHMQGRICQGRGEVVRPEMADSLTPSNSFENVQGVGFTLFWTVASPDLRVRHPTYSSQILHWSHAFPSIHGNCTLPQEYLNTFPAYSNSLPFTFLSKFKSSCTLSRNFLNNLY